MVLTAGAMVKIEQLAACVQDDDSWWYSKPVKYLIYNQFSQR